MDWVAKLFSFVPGWARLWQWYIYQYKDKFQISIYFVILVLTNEAIVSVTIYVQTEDNAGETDKFVIFEQSSEANSPHPPISHTNKVVMTT